MISHLHSHRRRQCGGRQGKRGKGRHVAQGGVYVSRSQQEVRIAGKIKREQAGSPGQHRWKPQEAIVIQSQPAKT